MVRVSIVLKIQIKNQVIPSRSQYDHQVENISPISKILFSKITARNSLLLLSI